MGRVWLPGNLLALGVISIANHGLPQWAVGVFLLLEGKKNERSCHEFKELPSACH